MVYIKNNITEYLQTDERTLVWFYLPIYTFLLFLDNAEKQNDVSL